MMLLKSLALGLVVWAATPSLSMAQGKLRLTAPASVPTDFLQWVDLAPGDVSTLLADLGVKARFTLSRQTIETSDLDTLKALNRLRMFAHLETPGLRPPIFDLQLSDGGRCLTRFPRAIAPDLSFSDVARSDVPLDGAEPELLSACRVTGKDPYTALSREAFRDRYFDAQGLLRLEFYELNSDPDFLAAIIDRGFFANPESYSGFVTVE